MEVEAFLEVDVNDVVATTDAVERHGAAINIDTIENRNLLRSRQNVVCNFLKVSELTRYKSQRLSNLRSRHAHLVPPNSNEAKTAVS